MSTRTSRGKQAKKEQTIPKKSSSLRQHRTSAPRKRGWHPGLTITVVVGAAIIGLAMIFFLNNTANTSTGNGQTNQYSYQVGNPGIGLQAPSINLPSTGGGVFNLADMHGKTVLLYFQEGLTCQPCWDQLKDIQSNIAKFQALGINQVVSITTDPLNAIQQKVQDQGITLPVLSDQNLAVSQTYSTNSYGMMGNSRDGHTFVVVGPDGRIRWRADYGGAPNYTMYVPISNLVAALREGLHGSSS